MKFSQLFETERSNKREMELPSALERNLWNRQQYLDGLVNLFINIL